MHIRSGCDLNNYYSNTCYYNVYNDNIANFFERRRCNRNRGYGPALYRDS
jgi:hypothetical protein